MPFTNTIGSNTIQGYRSLSADDSDPLFNDVVLLLQPTAADGRAYDDKSRFNYSNSINSLRGSTPSLDTSNSKWGNDYKVIDLNNSSSDIICADYISNLIASSSNPDTWTVEMWFMFDSVPNTGSQFNLISFHGSTFGDPADNPHVDNYITLWAGNQNGNASGQHFYAIIEENGNESIKTDIATFTSSKYYHVAIVNDNKTINIYIDGQRVVSTSIQTTVRGSYGDNDRDSFQIGADQDNQATNDYADIRIAGIRVTRNQARYTGAADFPSNSPFPIKGTSTTILGGDSATPITSEVEGLRYLDTFNLGLTPTLAWIQHPRINGNNAYEAYLIKDSGNLWILAAKLASDDLNSQIYSGSAVTGTQSGFPSFTWQDFPASSTVNDWGTDTHTYNDKAYDTTTNKSMRTRAWPELRSKFKRIYIADWNHADGSAANASGRILYIQSRGRFNENEIGVNQSWGEFMENPSADDPNSHGMGQNDSDASGTGRFGGNDYPADTTHIWPNEIDGGGNSLAVAGMSSYANSWGFAGLNHLYLGASDRENTDANTNDCAMISGATGLRIPSGMPTNDGALGTAGVGGMNSITGIGVKRSRISTANGFAIEFNGNQTTSTTPPKGNNITAQNINDGGYHGNFCTLMGNGRVMIEENARMNLWTRLQGGDGSTIDRAFDGSLMELDALWYDNAIPNGVYWFKTDILGAVAVDVVTRGGKKWIQIPFGTTTSSAGVTLTSAKLADKDSPAANFYVFNVTIGGSVGTGAATVANLTFDSDNRFGNGDNDSTTTKGSVDHNANIGWGVWNIGIPFRQLQYTMTFKSHWATGTGGSNADWNGKQHETPWNPTEIQPQYANDGGDWPFIMIPDPADPLNKMIEVGGATSANTNGYRTSGWTGAGDQGVVTRTMETTSTIEMGKVGSGARQDEHASEAYRVGIGFAGFGQETYRAESGVFFIR